DWHGHRDRSVEIANCFAAIDAGVDRVHGTALGVGERAGNVPIDLLMVNLKVEGFIRNNLEKLPEYAKFASIILDISTPDGVR
ncbi:MAG: 2-isopropylmalate synthase, partial [Nitrososphaerota archaeon]